MAAPPHGRTFGHRRAASQGGADAPPSEGLLLRDTRLRQWHPVVAKLTGTTLNLLRTEQNTSEQYPIHDAKIDVVQEGGRECVRVVLASGDRLILHHASDSERRRLQTELATACGGFIAQRSPAPSSSPAPLSPPALPPPQLQPVGQNSPRLLPQSLYTPIAIPKPPSHAPPPPPVASDAPVTRLPVVENTASRASNAGVRVLPQAPAGGSLRPLNRPSSPPPQLVPTTRPVQQPTGGAQHRPTSPPQRPLSPNKAAPVSPRFASAYPAPLPPPITSTGTSRSTYGGELGFASPPRLPPPPATTSPSRGPPPHAPTELPPPAPSRANLLHDRELPPAPPSMALARPLSPREMPPAPPSMVMLNRDRELPPAPPSMSIPRPLSPRPSSPLPRANAPLPPPLVLPTPPAAAAAVLPSPARVSVSPRPGGADEDEEAWNKKYSEEERQAELQSSLTEQRVIDRLRGTLSRVMRPRTRDSLLAPAMLHSTAEDDDADVAAGGGGGAGEAGAPKRMVDTQPLIKETVGFRLELGRATPLNDVSLNLYDYTDHYKTKFNGKPQYTFIGYLGSGSSEPTIISVLQEPQTSKFPEPTFFGLVRTKSSGQDEFFVLESDLQAFVTSNKLQKKKLHLQLLQHLQANFFRNAKLFYVENPAIQPFLVKFEEQDPERSPAFAFAVTYAGPSDKTAIEMFNHKDGSADFDDFLKLLGDKIVLQGWQRFRGGLDVLHNTKGTHSYFTTFSKFDIMFHVSTLLPFIASDPLKLVRARQVQNDVVMVIFRDGDASTLDAYDPLIQPTNVTHVFIVVAPLRINGVLHYKVAVASKTNVTAFRPDLPLPAVFKADADFRTFLLTKLVNAQIATRKSGLHLMFTRPRAAMLNDVVQRFLTAKERQELEREEAAP